MTGQASRRPPAVPDEDAQHVLAALDTDAQRVLAAFDTDAQRVLAALGETGCTVAVAESLTGGAVTSALVGIPGASVSLRGGVVAYATDVKADLLRVPAELLVEHGPVHPDVALAMARGVRRLLGADYGLATTGVAGPDAVGLDPAGTFHVAVCGPGDDGEVVSARGTGSRSRAQVRADAVHAVLTLAHRWISAPA